MNNSVEINKVEINKVEINKVEIDKVEFKCCICMNIDFDEIKSDNPVKFNSVEFDRVEFDFVNFIKFKCNHNICLMCYTEYSITRIKNMKSITCPICNKLIIDIKDITSIDINDNNVLQNEIDPDDFRILPNDDELHRNNHHFDDDDDNQIDNQIDGQNDGQFNNDNLHQYDNQNNKINKIDLNCMDSETLRIMRLSGMTDKQIKISILNEMNFK